MSPAPSSTQQRRSYLRLFVLALRVGCSAVAGALCLLFLILWVRSYWFVEGGMFCTFPGQHISFHGGSGRMCVWFEHSAAPRWYRWTSRPNNSRISPRDKDRMPWFDLAPFWPKMTRLYVAHWFLAVATGCLAIAPWAPRSFSLRGVMLIVTLVAILAAVIAWIDSTL